MTYSPGTIVSDLSTIGVKTPEGETPDNEANKTPDPPAPGSEGPVVDTPTMSHAEAVSRRDALISDATFREKLLAGDVDSKHEWDAVVRGLAYGKVPEPAAPDSPEGLTDWALSIVPDLTEVHLEEIRTSRPISPDVRRRAEQWKAVHFRDPAFVQAYFDGDPEVARQIFHLNTVLSLPVRG